jgi:hypothetical protein
MPPTSPRTKPGTRKLSDLAKHLAVPADLASTGWPAVRRTCVEKLGITFDDWQDAAGRLILAKRADGSLAAMVDGVGLSLPRQVGKTYLVGALTFALCVNTPGLLVIWSAHHARTHGETFLAMQSFADRSKVKAHVKQVFTGSGDEEIRFHNGSRILFGARERGFGRGIPGVDVLIFDEAQILSDRALSNMLATMNTSRFGLALYIGTPPKPDDMSESFQRMRAEALAGTLHDGAWIEFGADPDAKPDDRSQWAKANPSFPRRTPAQSILRLKRKLAEADFLREGMGVWDEQQVAHQAVIPAASWSVLVNESPPADDVAPAALAVDMSHDRVIAIAGAWVSETDLHVELLALDRAADTAGAVDWLVERAGRRIPVVVDSYSPAAAMVPDLRARRVKLIVTTAPDLVKACGGFHNDALSGRLRHAGQKQLTEAVAGARKRAIGQAGGWAWDRKDPSQNIAPLVAATLARFGAVVTSKPKSSRSRQRGGGRTAVML